VYEPVAPAQLAGLELPVNAVGVDIATIEIVWVNKHPLPSLTVTEYVPGANPFIEVDVEKAPLLTA
jgi:hypothetical protein